MAPKSKNQKKKVAALSAALQKEVKKTKKNSLFEKISRSFRVGASIQPRVDLSRVVKWPKYVTLQRKKSIILKRLKSPPAVNQFNVAIDKNQASQLLRLMKKYSPETKEAKKQRLLTMAKAQESGKEVESKKPLMLKYGLNHVTSLIESKQAKLVVIAHDVDPLEMVIWLPALCRKKDVPYCIIKGKSRLGQLVHKKTAACVAVTSVKREDQSEFEKLCDNFKASYNDNVDLRRRWGGGIMGVKSQHKTAKIQKAKDAEEAKKMGMTLG
jgi:large subunit ribosomal protein L7Ae